MQSRPGWPASGVKLLVFDYRDTDRRAVVSWHPEDEATPWLGIARDVLLSGSKEASQEGGTTISLPWWSFLGLRPIIFDLIRGFKLVSGVGYRVSERAGDHLRLARSRVEGYAQAVSANRLAPEELKQRLASAGFARNLTEQQLRNVSKLALLPAGATFSVPGAGKTTEALATFAVRSEPGDRLLVIAPKNAFAAWDEQIETCLPSFGQQFVRLRKTDKSHSSCSTIRG